VGLARALCPRPDRSVEFRTVASCVGGASPPSEGSVRFVGCGRGCLRGDSERGLLVCLLRIGWVRSFAPSLWRDRWRWWWCFLVVRAPLECRILKTKE
jgi:hypothetical protein